MIFGVRGSYLAWRERGLTVVCPIDTKMHHVVSLGPGVDLSARLGPSIVLASFGIYVHLLGFIGH